ncbi:MAG: tetraacyldisaccharide 4'-kinase [Tidjanibacter sp.]|nr:tetraacyldisaccharide 4'-kinase [Tidjanibacter sp.]
MKSIAAALYGAAVAVRNWLYDLKILKSTQFDLPVICVGNVAVGGTGKTPTVEFLVDKLGDQYTIAVLSRGYRRRTKGYREVQVGDSFLNVGDEPKQIKRKFPDTVVVVCENRVEAIRRIQQEHPEVNLVIMDDGFQHRSLTPKVSIVLSDYSTPPFQNKMLPAGTLRDNPSQLYRANILIVTKTPTTMTPIERNIAKKDLKFDECPYQSIFFTDTKQGHLKPIFSDVAPTVVPRGSKVVALAGIANPSRFFESLESRFEVVEKIAYGDHHTYRVKEIRQLQRLIESYGEKAVVITTEKDGVKLTSRKHIPKELQERLYVLPIELNFRDGDEKQFVSKVISELKNKQ